MDYFESWTIAYVLFCRGFDLVPGTDTLYPYSIERECTGSLEERMPSVHIR